MTTADMKMEWKSLLEKALVENDKEKLQVKIHDLETALFLRSQEMHTYGGIDVERESVQDAAQKLLKIKAEKLGYPMDPKILGGPSSAAESQ